MLILTLHSFRGDVEIIGKLSELFPTDLQNKLPLPIDPQNHRKTTENYCYWSDINWCALHRTVTSPKQYYFKFQSILPECFLPQTRKKMRAFSLGVLLMDITGTLIDLVII